MAKPKFTWWPPGWFRRHKLIRLAFELPTLTRKGKKMADFPLLNDAVYTVPIQATNSAGAVEPLPSGDTFTVTSSAPASLSASMGSTAAGNAAVVLTPLVDTATAITITVSDSTGLTAATAIFDIVADTTPVALVLDLPDATHVSQAIPPATTPPAA